MCQRPKCVSSGIVVRSINLRKTKDESKFVVFYQCFVQPCLLKCIHSFTIFFSSELESKLEASELKISTLTSDIEALTEHKNRSEEELESREDINKRLVESNNQLKDKLSRYFVEDSLS
jgi:hypothetical protein